MFRTLSLSLLACSLICSAQQKAVLVPDVDTLSPATAAHDWHVATPTFTLMPSGPGARSGLVWVRKTVDGLVVAGHVDGPAPNFPSTPAELMGKDHVEIWMAVDPNPQMPVMGWGNQFGDKELPKGELSCSEVNGKDGDNSDKESAEACRTWAIKQKSYRIHIRRLFARQWQLAPQVGVETFAMPAYRQIEQMFAGASGENFILLPKAIKPEAVPELKVKPRGDSGYDFETLVRWKSFPPAAETTLRDVYLLVEVFSPAAEGKKSGPYATTSPGRAYADFSSFSRIQFEKPRQFQISPCHYAFSGVDFWDNLTGGYFLPSREELIADTFVLENYRGGYAYEPTGLSPQVRLGSFFWKEVGPGEYVCGPPLRYYAAGKGTDLKFTVRDNTRQVSVDKDGLDVRRIPGGPLMIRDGPLISWSKFGSGQCGACPRAELVIYSLDDNLKFSELLRVFGVVGNELDDMDIQVAKDWSRVGIYRHKEDAWDDEFYCLKDGSYTKCGPATHTPPPEPRTLNLSPDDRYSSRP